MIQADPYRFFALVFALSLPFWGFGLLIPEEMLPGLPVSALMVVVPSTAAAILVWRDGTPGALRSFLLRSLDWRAMPSWAWLVALGTMPLVMALSAAWLVVTGADLPASQFDLLQILVLLGVFILAATAEELGWSGYASDPLLARHGLLAAGTIIGLVTVAWHVIPLLQAGRTWEWIAWWSLGAIARRLIILWLYMRGGRSVFATSLFHAMSNVAWMSFPVMGSHYDPASVAVILIGAAALCFIQDRIGHRPDQT